MQPASGWGGGIGSDSEAFHAESRSQRWASSPTWDERDKAMVSARRVRRMGVSSADSVPGHPGLRGPRPTTISACPVISGIFLVD